MDIELVVEGTTMRGTLDESSASRDFASLLPLTLTLTDFHGTEKISDLPRALSTDGAPDGITPATGDITYFAPWGNLALFYNDFTYSEGLVALGHIEPGGADVLAALADDTTVVITAAP